MTSLFSRDAPPPSRVLPELVHLTSGRDALYCDAWIDPSDRVLLAQRSSSPPVVEGWDVAAVALHGDAAGDRVPRRVWCCQMLPVSARAAFSSPAAGLVAFVEPAPSGGDVVLRALSSGKRRGDVSVGTRIWACCFAADSLQVAVSSRDGVAVFDVAVGESSSEGSASLTATRRTRQHTEPLPHIEQLVFVRGDALLAAATATTGYFFDAATCSLLLSVDGVRAFVVSNPCGVVVQRDGERTAELWLPGASAGDALRRTVLEHAGGPICASEDGQLTIAASLSKWSTSALCVSPCGTFFATSFWSDTQRGHAVGACAHGGSWSASLGGTVTRGWPRQELAVVTLGALLAAAVSKAGRSVTLYALPLLPKVALASAVAPACLPTWLVEDVAAFGEVGEMRRAQGRT